MAAIDDLKGEWLVKIATISDDLRKADATFELDSLIAAKVKLAAAQTHEVSSYSITGRSVTRKTLDELASSVTAIERKLVNYVYDSHDLADMDTSREATQL